MPTVTVLYTSGAIHSAIKRLFLNPSRKERRVVLVAYVGADALKLLPYAKGIQIVCSPTPLATDHAAVQELRRRGADVRFSDKLHMKVYWSSKRGAVITSANLSQNAFGIGALREAGVFLPPGTVDIDKFLQLAAPRKLTAKELEKMARVAAATKKHVPMEKGLRRSFLQWYEAPDREATWKLGWYDGWDDTIDFSKSAVAYAKENYQLKKPHSFMFGAKGQYTADDWLLCFDLGTGAVRRLEWMFTDAVVAIGKSDPQYDEETPFQAIQLFPKGRHYRHPPFSLSPDFNKAFEGAVGDYGIEKLKANMNLVPTDDFLERVAHRLRSRRQAHAAVI